MRLFNIRRSANLHAQAFADHLLEGRRVPRRSPQLELGIAARPHLQQRIVAAIVKLDVGQALRVAPVEAFGEPQDGGQGFNGPAPLPGQLRVVFVSPLGRRAAMVTRDERHRVDLIGLESPEITILDQIVRMPVMTLVADMRADVVEERGSSHSRSRSVRPWTARVCSKMANASRATWCAWSGQ